MQMCRVHQLSLSDTSYTIKSLSQRSSSGNLLQASLHLYVGNPISGLPTLMPM